MQAQQVMKVRWTAEEKERIKVYTHLSPREAMPYFPGRTYKSVKSKLYQQHCRENNQNTVRYYTPRDTYNIVGLNKTERFKLEYRMLPQGDLETADLSHVEIPKIIDFDVYALRFGFMLNDEVLMNKAA